MKYVILAACASLILYCGHAATTSPMPDAQAQDAGNGDGGVCEVHCPDPPPRCQQCQIITTYHMELDHNGGGTLQLTDPTHSMVQVWIYDADGILTPTNRFVINVGTDPATLAILPDSLNAFETARITIIQPTE